MLIIAERINATRKRIRKAILERDAELIKAETKKQLAVGGNYIDANAGIEASREPDDLKWLVETIQSEAECPISLDSTNVNALKAALPLVKTKPVMINSITGEKGRYEEVLPLVRDFNTLVVALTIGPEGMPTSIDARLEAACTRALAAGARSYRHVASILKSGLDRLPVEPAEPEPPATGTHENVRGRTYYH